jgi:predicted O-methyltransferase YrrM
MLDDMIDRVETARAWLSNNSFPENEVTRRMRASKHFEHDGQMLLTAHRTPDTLCDLMCAWGITNGYTSYLEIGTLFGYSTLHFAESAKRTGGRLATVDLRLHERVWHTGETVRDIHTAAEKFIREAGLDDVVDFHEGRSEAVLSQFVLERRSFDLIFIDGSHSRFVVTLDVLNALNLISDNGVIFMDDISESIAVKDTFHGGPNSILPAFIASGRFDIIMPTPATLAMRPKAR